MTIHERIDQYLNDRFSSGEKEKIEKLADEILRSGVSIAEVESMLRSGYAHYPDMSQSKGQIIQKQMTCDYTGIRFHYFLYIPENYHLSVQHSLTIVAHGGNNAMSPSEANQTAFDYIQAYLPMGIQGGHILAAPASTFGWGAIGTGNVFSLISRLVRRLHIHPDKIHLTGQSMGGHLAYRMAMWFSDRFGALSPHSGGYDYVTQETIRNLVDAKAYCVFGEYEPYGINEANHINAKWLKAHRQENWVFVEKKSGGHAIYPDEFPNILHFFSQFPRNLYPSSVNIKIKGKMKFEGEGHPNWGTQKIMPLPGRSFYSDSRYWIRIVEGDFSGQWIELQATIGQNNHIQIQTKNITKLEIMLHPKMLNAVLPVTIIINGKIRKQETIKTTLPQLLSIVKQWDDRGRIFYTKWAFDI